MKGKFVWLLLTCLIVTALVLTSCGGKPVTKIVEEFLQAEDELWNTGNADPLMEIEDPDIVVHMWGSSDLVGNEAHKQTILGLRGSFPGIEHEWADVTGTGDIGAFRYTERFEFAGKEVEYEGAMFLHVKNGKIVEIYMLYDTMSLSQQLGLVPASSQ
jgi:predicted ester cyclase